MAVDKIFACPNCDANISVTDVRNMDTITCKSCSRHYQIRFVEPENAWELIPVVETEETPEEPAEQDEDNPFEVFGETGGPRDDDLDKL